MVRATSEIPLAAGAGATLADRTALLPIAGAARPRSGTEIAAALLAIVLALVAIGLVMVYSTTAVEAERSGDPTRYVRRQALFALLAGGALAIAWHTDYRKVLAARTHLLVATLVLLVLVLFAQPVNGARRWFDLGANHLQPSEIAKVALVVFLAGSCAEKEALKTFRSTAKICATLASLLVLIAVEPDFGTAAFLGVLAFAVLFVAGVRLAYAAAVGIPVAGAVALYAATHFEHVRNRIQVFLEPAADPLGKGYQIHQALIALGSGGFGGLGLGRSRQKLFFLPDDHTDFVLAILGEELGLVGTALVAALFAAFVAYGMRIAFRARDRGGFLLAFGLTATVGLQAAMNIAVVTASFPTKGISLPFISFGGSSLLVAMTSVGILLSIARKSAETPEASARQIGRDRAPRAQLDSEEVRDA